MYNVRKGTVPFRYRTGMGIINNFLNLYLVTVLVPYGTVSYSTGTGTIQIGRINIFL